MAVGVHIGEQTSLEKKINIIDILIELRPKHKQINMLSFKSKRRKGFEGSLAQSMGVHIKGETYLE